MVALVSLLSYLFPFYEDIMIKEQFEIGMAKHSAHPVFHVIVRVASSRKWLFVSFDNHSLAKCSSTRRTCQRISVSALVGIRTGAIKCIAAETFWTAHIWGCRGLEIKDLQHSADIRQNAGYDWTCLRIQRSMLWYCFSYYQLPTGKLEITIVHGGAGNKKECNHHDVANHSDGIDQRTRIFCIYF